MSCMLFNMKIPSQDQKDHSSNLLIDRMYSVAAFNIWVFGVLSKDMSPNRKKHWLELNQYFLITFNQCFLERSGKFVF